MRCIKIGVHMVQKVFRTGDTLAVSLPNEAIELLGLYEGCEVDVVFAPETQEVQISPAGVATTGIDAEFARQLDAFIAHYRPALVALAR